MSDCTNIQFISADEFIGDSLPKINTNFSLLSAAACNLKLQIDARVNVRTFFYYGPNAPTDSEAGTIDENTNLAYPSTTTITRFVTGANGLNLLPVSEVGDIVWVIYQKTGWTSQNVNYLRQGSGSIPFTRDESYEIQVPVTSTRKIGIGRSVTVTTYRTETLSKPVTYWAGYSWSTTVTDTYNEIAPIFVLYQLKHNGSNYAMVDTPKFIRSMTASTANWSNPTAWAQYNISDPNA